MNAGPVNAPRGPGAILKQHRQEKNLELQNVAAQMRLEPRIIEALEADAYASLPATLYVRGYIRGYAKILKLDPEPLIEQFDHSVSTELPEIIPEVKQSSQTGSGDRQVKAVSYLVGFGLLLLLFASWQTGLVVEAGRKMGSAIGLDTGTSSGTAAATAAIAPATTQETAPPEPPPPAPEYRTAPAAEPALTLATSASPSDASGNALTPGALVAALPASTGPDQIVLRLAGNSWIEITDSRQQQVFFGLAREGETLTLNGTAPFNVLLGYSQGVTVQYNGAAFDPAPYSRSGIARFTLGE